MAQLRPYTLQIQLLASGNPSVGDWNCAYASKPAEGFGRRLMRVSAGEVIVFSRASIRRFTASFVFSLKCSVRTLCHIVALLASTLVVAQAQVTRTGIKTNTKQACLPTSTVSPIA